MIPARALTVRGTGKHLSVAHVYNNRSLARAFGIGWSLNTGHDVGLSFDGQDVILHGDSAYCARFAHTSNGFNQAPGVGAELEHRPEVDRWHSRGKPTRSPR